MHEVNAENDLFAKGIGIALSGGGFRAAAFHLGSIAYLEHVGLGDKITMISTVSGGTFTGMQYALAKADKQPYPAAFQDYYHFLNRPQNIVQKGFKLLLEHEYLPPSGRKNTIIATAEAYAQTFLQDANQQPILFEKVLTAETQLKNVIFNATGYWRGEAYRFQSCKGEAGSAVIGSENYPLTAEEAGNIRMADILAASAGFPFGFEPLAFPTDFIWNNNDIPPKIKQQFTHPDGSPHPLPLLDGGVYDNNGIESLLLVSAAPSDTPNPQRREDELDIFIISDVDSAPNHYYEMPAPPQPGWFKLGYLVWLIRILIGLSFMSTAALAYQFYTNILLEPMGVTFKLFDTVVFLVLYFIPLLLTLSCALGLWWLLHFIRTHILRDFFQVPKALWPQLRGYKLQEIYYMLKLRLGIVTPLLFIMMGRIRELMYKAVYQNPHYEGKRVSNLIYHLSTDVKQRQKFTDYVAKFDAQGLTGVTVPSPALDEEIDIANAMPLTLWFENDRQLPALVICGQATMCYNLMKFLVRFKQNHPEAWSSAHQALWERLLQDWQELCDNPQSLLNKLLV